MIEVNYDEVICPNCVTQFRAIPVKVQDELRKQADAIERLENEALAATLRIDNDALTITELTKEKDTCGSGAGCLHKDAVIESLKRDAARYRAVRLQDCAITGVCHEVFDAAIDSAIRGVE